MYSRPVWLTLACAVLLSASLYAQTTYYVLTNGNDAANGLSWATAKSNIEAAVTLAACRA